MGSPAAPFCCLSVTSARMSSISQASEAISMASSSSVSSRKRSTSPVSQILNPRRLCKGGFCGSLVDIQMC
jgi:hypothetical protein